MFLRIAPGRAARLLASAAEPLALAAGLTLPARGETVIVNGAAGSDGSDGGTGFAGGPGERRPGRGVRHHQDLLQCGSGRRCRLQFRRRQ
jgi:hypothetical protein